MEAFVFLVRPHFIVQSVNFGGRGNWNAVEILWGHTFGCGWVEIVNYLTCKRFSSASEENGNGRESESLSGITIVMQIYGVFEWSVEDNVISRTGRHFVVTKNTHPQSVFLLISKIRNISHQAHTFDILLPSQSLFSTHWTIKHIKRRGPFQAW